MDELSVTHVVAALGLLLGLAFGATAQRTNFCTMGAISDIAVIGRWNRFRAWMLAIAVAILGSQGLHLAGLVDLGQSIYLSATLDWAGGIVGGLLFGFGMTLAGGCGNRNLVRLGAGNLKSLVVLLVLGTFAYMTMRGLFAGARMAGEATLALDLRPAGIAAQGLPDLLARATGLAAGVARAGVALLAAAGLLWFCLGSAEFRAARADVASGLILGALVTIGWAITGIVGADPFEPVPVASVTFVAPVGDGLLYLMTFTGATITFGIATVGGVVLGSFLMALATGGFRIEAFTDAADMGRHLTGAALMGAGGVLALGCTIGQGMTGISTLSLGSLIALAAISAGGFLGMRYLAEGSLGAALRSLIARG
ncbi:MAG: YeeE/YedE family protein [Alphaproteobacteria bacterium]|nr:YeeE/YedE family protein [Alphaproteobacteria bacterium]